MDAVWDVEVTDDEDEDHGEDEECCLPTLCNPNMKPLGGISYSGNRRLALDLHQGKSPANW